MTGSRAVRLLIGAGATTALLLPATVASAGSVSSGPLTLTIKDSPFVVKGTQESLSTFYCGLGGEVIEGATVRQALSASSPYGIASWDVAPYYSYDYPGPWTHYAQSAAPVIQYAKDNYSDDCGGGIHNGRGVVVRVTDTHGNVAELTELERLFFQRWDNTTAAFDGSGSLSSFSFGTAWSAYNPCGQCDNGSTIYTTKAGASAVYTLNSTWSNNGGIGAHLGLAMTEGPGHGAVKLYLDGVLKATVNTYSAKWKYRTYVYDFGPLTIGAHTVKLVNVGTAGRPRIDVQGMALVVGSAFVWNCDPDVCPNGP